MQFESFAEAHSFLLLSSFIVALIMGAVVNKTNFCTMGAISDMVNMGSYSRFKSWLLAIAVALISITVFEYFELISLNSSFPPYRGSTIIFGENIIGGIIFGVGMTFASGCGNKTLIRLGAGNLKSLVVLIVLSITAYFMTNPFPNSDQTLYSTLFYDWIRVLSISVEGSSDIASLISSEHSKTARLILGLMISFGLFIHVFKNSEFRTNKNNIVAGLVVGLAVTAGWWITSNTQIETDDEQYSLSGYYQEWDMLEDDDQLKPAQARTLESQSLTFINPVGQILGYVQSKFDSALLTFGLVSVFGIILGSMLMALVTKRLSLEWFSTVQDFVHHFVGAIMMGVGGVLALGCTIGQGITGLSTLALGSFITFAAIVFGSTLTMKAKYYRLIYDDAGLYAAIISSLVDLHLAPEVMRKLEAVD